jgi:hypothetical protein
MHAWDRLRKGTTSFVFVLVLIVSAMATQPARADNGTPPPPAPPPGSSNTASTSGSNTTLAQVPAGTGVVVLDRPGHKVALASQEAAHIVASGDPIWCPTGVLPKSSVGGCSPSYSGFSGLGGLGFWLGLADPTMTKPGVIWIEGDYLGGYQSSVNDSGMTDLTFNGSTLPHMAALSLTIKGGWNGISGSTITNPNTPSLFDSSSVSIINWHAPVTISDIMVTGVIANPYEPYALSVQTDKGGITLNRVQAINNYASSFASGAHLDTSTAVSLSPVTVTDSVFNSNYGGGLFIQSYGAIVIRNLIADYNGSPAHNGDGADIINEFSNTNQPITLTGTNEFKGNSGNGIGIESSGTVTLNNMTANLNNNGSGTGFGAEIFNNFGSSPSNVVLKGTNLFTYNGQGGLFITSNGNILLNNITASDNLNTGASLDNCIRSGFGPCSITGKSVTLTGINSFNRNSGSGDGLAVFASGAITISQVTADHDNYDGAYLDNCAYDFAAKCTMLVPYNITLTSASTFENNSFNGLYINATGAVMLKNLTASFNHGDGAQILNNDRLLTPRPVTIGGTNAFNGNDYDGLYVYSYGSIMLSNITANDNGRSLSTGFGAELNNEGFDGGVSGATVITRFPVTLTGVNTFNNNYYGGLQVTSVGAISVSNVSASNNSIGTYYDGVSLSNVDHWYPNSGSNTPYAASVTISGFGFFENNGYNGLTIYSRGVVTLANLTAFTNYNKGADIETTGFTLPQNVTLTGVNTFYGNGAGSGTGDGLYVLNDGKITISNLSATDNRGAGANLDNFINHKPGKFLGVTLTGFNTFEQNLGSYGVFIHTDGSVLMSHINADNNTGIGIGVIATKNITLMCGSAFQNNQGLALSSGNTITLTGVHSFSNPVSDSLSAPHVLGTYACP